MTTMTETSWAQDLLKRMGYPASKNNMTTVLAWEYAEGGHFNNSAHFNPLNTTRDSAKYGVMAGGNSSGVATYPDYETGMKETVATLKLGYYDGVRKDLSRSAAPATTVAAIAASPWGTWKGVGTGAALDRAKKEVHDHPGIVTAGAKPTGGGTPTSGGTKPPTSGGASTGTSKGKNTVVLDLDELARLTTTYRNGSDEILRHRKVVGDIAAAVEPARAALTDKGLATVIQSTFNWLLETGGGFERDARLHSELATYIDDIHRLAGEADSDKNGAWSKSEATAFATKHKGETGAALTAVLAALAGGTIRTKTKLVVEAGKTGSAVGGAVAAAPTRKQKIDTMLAYANKQHAIEVGDNHTKYGKWFGADGSAWCAQFVSYVFAHSGTPLPVIDGTKGKPGFQYCPDAINYARAHGQLHNAPHVGDIFLRQDGQHTGIVTKVNSNGTFDTVEGNAGNNTDRVVHGNRVVSKGTYYFWTAIK